MKKLILIIVVMAGFSATANAVDLMWCQENIPFSSDKDVCARAVRGNFFDQGVGDFCKAVPFSDDKIACLKVVANKIYSQDELSFCSNKSFSDDKVACMAEMGTDYRSRDRRRRATAERRLELITDLADSAIEYLEQGQFAGAILKIYEILELARSDEQQQLIRRR